MNLNTISIIASLVNGTQFELLSNTPSEVAMAEYFCADIYPSVQSLTIEPATNEGQQIRLQISANGITAIVE